MGARRNPVRGGLSLWFAAALGAVAIACGDPQEAPEPEHATVTFNQEAGRKLHPDYSKPYVFSDDWFSGSISNWRRVLEPMAGRPDLHYLEIGVYEGRSFIWVLEQILTHPTSRLTAVDIFIPSEIEARFLANVELSGHADRVTTIKGYSQVELRKLPLDSFDIIYVDGSHTAEDVLADAILSWGLLKDDGILIFDDYRWDGSFFSGKGNPLPAELLPNLAINAFIQTHRSYLEVLQHGYQMVVQKRANPCPNKHMCTPIGPYLYDWQTKRLTRTGDPADVPLSQLEQRLMERILRTRKIGLNGYELAPALAADPGVRELVARLQLEFVSPP